MQMHKHYITVRPKKDTYKPQKKKKKRTKHSNDHNIKHILRDPNKNCQHIN